MNAYARKRQTHQKTGEAAAANTGHFVTEKHTKAGCDESSAPTSSQTTSNLFSSREAARINEEKVAEAGRAPTSDRATSNVFSGHEVARTEEQMVAEAVSVPTSRQATCKVFSGHEAARIERRRRLPW